MASEKQPRTPDSCTGNIAVVTKSDSTVLPETIGLYVGVTGDVAIADRDGTSVTLTGLAAGMWHGVRTTKVFSTGTTATNIVAMWAE